MTSSEAAGRPTSITVVIVLVWINAVLTAAGGVVTILERNNELVLEETGLTSTQTLWLGILYLAFAALLVVTAIGIAKGVSAARVVLGFVLFFQIASALLALIGWSGSTRLQGLVQGSVALIIMYFLFDTQEAREYFA